MTDEVRPVLCPACGTRYSVEPKLLAGEVLVLCGICRAGFRVDGGLVHAPEGDSLDDVDAIEDAGRPRVVVGHEHPATSRTIARVLRAGGYAPVCVRTGDDVLQACDPAMPAPVSAVCMDVAVPGVMAFEVIEQLRAMPDGATLPVVLLASVFERTRYKRRPSSLYGANAYLELHHVPDMLASTIDALRNAEEPGTGRLQAPAHRAATAPLRREPGDPDESHAVFARRLISDVALYHGAEIADGLLAGDPLAGIQDALSEAREKFIAGVSERDAPLFDAELDAFRDRLTARHPRRAEQDG